MVRVKSARRLLPWFLFRDLAHREDRGRLVSGLGRQVRNAGMEIQCHPLIPDAYDDSPTFRIPRNQLGLVRFFLNGYDLWCFGHDTEYADCTARPPVSNLCFYDHHQIIEPVASPTSQPANPPLTETGAKRNGCAESQVFRFQLHAR